MIDVFEFTDSTVRDVYNVTGFPLGIAIVGYLSEKENRAGYILIDKLYNELPMEKGQRMGEIPIIGRNTPVYQMFGGQGLKFMSLRAQFYGDTAHERFIQFAGLCDAGNPIWFACDRWLRKVVIATYTGSMITHSQHYETQFDLFKFEDIEPLRYKRDIGDLSPFPGLGTGDVVIPGGDSGKNDVIEDVDGAKDSEVKPGNEWREIKDGQGRTLFRVPSANGCRMVTISYGDDWGELIRNNYEGNLSLEDVQLIRMAIKIYNREARNIHDSEYNDYDGTLKPAASLSICFPTEIEFPSNMERDAINYRVRRR